MSHDTRPAIRASYVICTTPRSGSNFLCELGWVIERLGYAPTP